MHYRREIDGLRAVAVLPVMLFHAGFSSFSGGFVGVDVFFVISGFLITSLILSEQEAGTFSLLGFYERRIRRILPALYCVMLACLPLAWFFMIPEQLHDFSRSVVSVLIFASNYYFRKDTGYFAEAAEEKALLHTWSLAVEEQFYLVFPLCLLAFRRCRQDWLTLFLLAAALTSLLYAQWQIDIKPQKLFYDTRGRLWELLLGALIPLYGLCGMQERLSGKWRQAAAFLGLALVLYAVFTFDAATPHPGFYTLIPTLGTALIIIFASSDTCIGRLLGCRPLVGIGLISYSAYLWHYALFAFAYNYSIGTPAKALLMALAGLSLVCAYATWRYVEQPFRNRQKTSRRKVFCITGAVGIILLLIGLIGNYQKGFPGRYAVPERIIHSSAMVHPMKECFDKPDMHTREDWLCRIGEDKEKAGFVVFGDSHALSLFPAFDAAGKAAGMGGVFSGASGCTPFLAIHALRPDQHKHNCHVLNQRVYDYVKQNKIRHLFLVARWTYYTDRGYTGNEYYSAIGLLPDSPGDLALSRHAFEVGLNATVEEYAKLGTRLVVVEQAPQQKYAAKKIYYKAFSNDPEQFIRNIRSLSIPYEKHRALQSYVGDLFRNYQASRNLNLVSPDHLFCDAQVCAAGNERMTFYADTDHLSAASAGMLTDEIKLHLLKK